MVGLVNGQPTVKLVSTETIFLLILVGILPTMGSVKNGFQAHLNHMKMCF
jgi:hypothetical protein